MPCDIAEPGAAQRVCKTTIKRFGGIDILVNNAEITLPQEEPYSLAARGWAEHVIRVNSIRPGYIRTEMSAESYADPSRRTERSARMMLPRWGEAADFIGRCIFLASDASGYVTGIDLPVDGGWAGKGM